jgi:uncharacterized delta-60 repeat protein
MGVACKGEFRLLTSFLILWCLATSAHAQPGQLDFGFNANASADWTITTLAVDSQGRIVVGGLFDRLNGVARPRFGRFLTNGLLDTNFNTAVTGIVDAVHIDVSNRVVLGGYFSYVNGVRRTNLARVNANGSLDMAFSPSMGSTVYALGMQPSGKLIVGGTFTNIMIAGTNSTRLGITRLNNDGSDDGSFSGRGFSSRVGLTAFIEAITVQPDGRILVGGGFHSFDGVGVSNLVRLNADTTLDTTFNAALNGGVSTMALQPDGKILIYGGFNRIGGVPRALARLNTDGSLDESFYPLAGGIQAIALDAESRIYIGGAFSDAGGVPRQNIARLHSDGALDTGFDPGSGANYVIYAMGVQPNGHVVIGGAFDRYNNEIRTRVARVLGGPAPPAAPVIVTQPTNQAVNAGSYAILFVGATGSPRLNFQWQFNGTNLPGSTRATYYVNFATPEHAGTYTVIVSNELGVVTSEPAVLTVVTYPPGFTRHPTNTALLEGQNLRWSVTATGAPPPTLQWQFNGSDLAGMRSGMFAITNVTFAHAGDYWVIASNLVGVTTSLVAHVTVGPASTNAGAVDISFVPQSRTFGGSTLYPPKAAAMQPDGKILVAGDYSALWRWLPDGQLDPAFTNSAAGGPGEILALAVQSDGKIIAAGRDYIARLNSNGARDTNFLGYQLGTAGIKAVAVQPDGKVVYAAGSPSSGGFPILGRVTSNGLPDVNFRTVLSPLPPGGSIGQAVNAYGVLLQPDGKIIFASSLFGVARFLPNGTRDLNFASFNLGLPVAALGMALQNDGKLVVGWNGNNDRGPTLVRLNADGTLDSTFRIDPIINAAAVNALALQPDGKIVAAGIFNGIGTRVMRFHPSGALDATFELGATATPAIYPTSYHLLLAPDCKPVLVGAFVQFNGYERDGVVRLLSDAPAAPSIARDPAVLTVRRGQIARFSANATCPPAPSYQWFFNGAPIPGANEPRLAILNAETTNAGSYSLSVTSPLGSNHSAVVSLTVNAPTTNAGAVDVDFMSAAPNDTVLAALRQPDGKLLIGGHFTRVGTNDRAYVARLNTDGSLDATFDAGAISNSVFGSVPPVVSALALQSDGAVLIGGTFTRVGGRVRNSLARLHSNGALDTNFLANGNLVRPVVALAMQTDGKLLVSHAYDYPGLLRLTTNGTVDTTFQSVSLPLGQPIKSIAFQSDGRILVAGEFSFIANATRTGLARLQTNGAVDLSFPDIQARVDTMALLGDAIVVGGTFTTIRGLPQRYLAAVDYSGGVLSNVWRPLVNQPVRLLAKDSCDRVLAAGNFTNAGSPVVRGLLRFLPDGRTDPSFSAPVFDSSVHAVVSTDEARIITAGAFTEVNGCYRPGVAWLFEGALTVPMFSSQPTNISTMMGHDFTLSASVLCPPGTVYQWQLNGADIAGATNTSVTFRNVRSPQSGGYWLIASNRFGMSTSAVAAVALSPAPTKPGDNHIDFYPDFTAAQRVTAMAVQSDGKLLAAHAPPGMGSALFRYHRDGTRDSSFNGPIQEPRRLAIGPDGGISAIGQVHLYRLQPDGTTNFVLGFPGAVLYDLALQPDGRIIVVGRSAAFPAPHRAWRFNTDGTMESTFAAPDFDSYTFCVARQQDGKVLIGGGFTSAGAARSPSLVRLTTNGTPDSNFISGFTSNALVYALAVQPDGRIIVGGNFTNYAGQLRHHIVRLHADGALDMSFNASLSGTAHRLALQRDGKILVAGSRLMEAGSQGGIVRLLADGAPDSTFESGPVGWDPIVLPELVMALAPDGDIYIGNGFTSYDGFTRLGIARLHGNPVILGPTYSSGSFSTSMSTDTGRTYHLESSGSLSNPAWSIVETVVGNGAVQVFNDSPANGTRYYRIRAD